MTTATLPLAALRARKVAALLALAHQAEVPTPLVMSVQEDEHLADLYFLADDAEMYAAWAEWLKPTETSSTGYLTATVTVELADLGPLTVEWFRSVA